MNIQVPYPKLLQQYKLYRDNFKVKKFQIKFLYFFLCLLFSIHTVSAYSQSIFPDNNFGTNGIVTLDFGGFNQTGKTIVLPNQKVLMYGRSVDTSGTNLIMARYNNDGTIDTTFGAGGFVYYPSSINARSSQIQQDGKILLAGYCAGGTALVACLSRYNPQGDIDSTFGINGLQLLELGAEYSAFNTILIQSDNKIICGGSANDGAVSYDDFALVRFTPDGQLDTSFGDTGVVITVISPYSEAISDMTLTGNGRILATSSSGGFLAQYNRDGTLDNGFGVNGISQIYIPYYNIYSVSLLIKSDGDILVGGGGSSAFNLDFDMLIFQCDSDGILDIDFGTTGYTLTDVAGSLLYDYGTDIELLGDGSILQSGISNSNASNKDVVLLKYYESGILDYTFDNDGIMVADISGYNDQCQSMEIQNDGKILLGGYIYNGDDYDLFLARYTFGVTDTEDIILDKRNIAYPNPSNNIIKILTTDIIEYLELYNSLGLLVYKQDFDNINEINVNNLATGQYYMRIYFNNKEGYETRKIIIVK